MSLRAWKRIAGLASLLLLIVPLAYTWVVFTRVPGQNWDWWNQLAATFFSVAFAATVAVWLYSWQTEKTSMERRNELRSVQIASIFNMWDLLDDKNLQTVPLPDGSEAKVLLTFLQPMVYEESVKSGLFGSSETIIMSRLAAIMHLYNSSAQRIPPLIEVMEAKRGEPADNERAKKLRDEIDSVLSNREKVVEAGKALISLWTLREVREALAIANPDEREDPDPRVAQLIEGHLPKILPPSYKAGIKANLNKAQAAITAGDTEAARGFLDQVIKETEDLRHSNRVTGDFEELISGALEAKESLDKEITGSP